jgi:hypothetical protein
MEEEKNEDLVRGIRYSVLYKKLGEIRSLERALTEAESKVSSLPRIGNWRAGLIAAAVIFVGTFTILLVLKSDDPKDLYLKNFEPYPNVFEPTQRGDNAVADKRALAFSLYEQKNYERAAALFTELLTEKKEPEILLLLGNANMVLNRDEEAKNNFLTLIRDFDALDEQAKWYLSLIYLKSGEREKAKVIWQELGDPKINYSEKAKKLLDEVN